MTAEEAGEPVAKLATLEDIDKLVFLENSSGSEDLWDRADFETILKEKKIRIVFLEHSGVPTSYIAVEVKRKEIIIWSLCVHPDRRRHRHGSAILSWLKKTNLTSFGNLLITSVVRESDLTAQLFLRHNQFRCTKTLRDAWECPPENGFLFQYKT